jgi:CheY-like chemotaxis protein
MRNHYKILITDDSLSLRNSVIAMLNEDQENTYSVFTATNGREACTSTYHERPDLVLIDIEMPIMSGIDAIRKIKGNNLIKHIPIIVMSSTKQFKEAFEAGADDFILKPFTTYELLIRIQQNIKLAEKGKEIKKQHELLNTQKQEAIIQRDIIFKQKTDLMDDLHYARHVQNAIMPSAEYLNILLDKHFVFNRPRYIVSGDFYWGVKKNELTMVAVGDCTGHGMSGALMTMVGVAFLNEFVNTHENFTADQVLNFLRENVIQLLNQKGEIGEASNGIDIALCIYNENTNILQFAGANNPLYLVRKNNPLEIFKGDRMPIGYFFQYNQPFSYTEISITKEDTIYLFTDGYADQFGGPFEKKFRYAQFKDLIEKAASLPTMDKQLELINKTMDEWIHGVEQIDDMLIMGFRFK